MGIITTRIVAVSTRLVPHGKYIRICVEPNPCLILIIITKNDFKGILACICEGRVPDKITVAVRCPNPRGVAGIDGDVR